MWPWARSPGPSSGAPSTRPSSSSSWPSWGWWGRSGPCSCYRWPCSSASPSPPWAWPPPPTCAAGRTSTSFSWPCFPCSSSRPPSTPSPPTRLPCRSSCSSPPSITAWPWCGPSTRAPWARAPSSTSSTWPSWGWRASPSPPAGWGTFCCARGARPGPAYLVAPLGAVVVGEAGAVVEVVVGEAGAVVVGEEGWPPDDGWLLEPFPGSEPDPGTGWSPPKRLPTVVSKREIVCPWTSCERGARAPTSMAVTSPTARRKTTTVITASRGQASRLAGREGGRRPLRPPAERSRHRARASHDRAARRRGRAPAGGSFPSGGAAGRAGTARSARQPGRHRRRVDHPGLDVLGRHPGPPPLGRRGVAGQPLLHPAVGLVDRVEEDGSPHGHHHAAEGRAHQRPGHPEEGCDDGRRHRGQDARHELGQADLHGRREWAGTVLR